MDNPLFIGIDIGATKIAAGLVTAQGEIISRKKTTTPSKTNSKEIIDAICSLISDIMQETRIPVKNLKGIGIGVPGIVDKKTGQIKITVNTGLSNANIARILKKKYACLVIIDNDVNLGIVGEKWLGAARQAKNVIGIFLGTGIGGGIIVDNQLLTGSTGAAAEIGHMIIQLQGPRCSCGNFGCLEALASRWALERDIRQAVKNEKKTIISKLTNNNLSLIKSKVIQQALKKNDPLTVSLIDTLSSNLAYACISLRHIFDPELFVFGGGLIEACGSFILPKVTKLIQNDPFFMKLSKCKVTCSLLGDDAVILGAVARINGTNIFTEDYAQKHPHINLVNTGQVEINGEIYDKDLYIRANGKIKKRCGKSLESSKEITAEEMDKLCKKNPEIIIIASNKKIPEQKLPVSKKPNIKIEVMPLKKAFAFYNQTRLRKAILIELGK
ncbi:MAG: ROK family protein [Candidatus Omnitrophica bacterium]|nr:ROK family protein [Candidatus Omnitrophota bacterium]